jgi:hypothetical protein
MKRTSKVHKRQRAKVLQVRIITPRIAWIGFLRFLGRLTKLALLLAALSAVGYGIKRGVEHVVYQNPDFQLGFIDLNPNTALDEGQLVEIARIPLDSNLFDLDFAEIEKTLNERPEIASATVERHLPDTLRVRLTARIPCAWIACPEENLPAQRRPGAMLVDPDGIPYPCPELQYTTATHLPTIIVPSIPEKPIRTGKPLTHPELKRCLRLLAAAAKDDPASIPEIDTIQQTNAWSLALTTRGQTVATFGLGDHDRQISDLRAALHHARESQYSIATINLIPKENIPVTTRSEAAPPRAIPIQEPTPGELREERRTRDLDTLLNRR